MIAGKPKVRIVHYSVVAAGVAVLGLAAPKSATSTIEQADGSSMVMLTGVIRDFRGSNDDFTMIPSGGFGHYAGNVDLALSSDNVPVFTGSGYKVADQWLDIDDNPIAPHLYQEADPPIVLATLPESTKDNVLDTWDSDAGPYGGTNVGPEPEWATDLPMPSVSAPSPLPAKVAKKEYKNLGVTTLSDNVYCGDFVLQNSHILRISGDIWIYATDSFKIENAGKLEVLDGSELTVYIGKDANIQNNTEVNMTSWDPSRLTIINLGTTDITFENSGDVCGAIISPDARVILKNSHQFYGSIIAKGLKMSNTSGVHVELGDAVNPCGAAMDDTPGSASSASTGGIASAAHFHQWFTDSLGANLSTYHQILLADNGAGVFEYFDDAFFPIDGRLFGNENDDHNYYFTYSFTVEFVHHACDGRFFEFYGCDDAWMFIDGELAMDLGGMVADTAQYVDLDRFELVDGETYRLHFFYAQRNRDYSIFRIRTNLDLKAESTGNVVSGTFD